MRLDASHNYMVRSILSISHQNILFKIIFRDKNPAKRHIVSAFFTAYVNFKQRQENSIGTFFKRPKWSHPVLYECYKLGQHQYLPHTKLTMKTIFIGSSIKT